MFGCSKSAPPTFDTNATGFQAKNGSTNSIVVAAAAAIQPRARRASLRHRNSATNTTIGSAYSLNATTQPSATADVHHKVCPARPRTSSDHASATMPSSTRNDAAVSLLPSVE